MSDKPRIAYILQDFHIGGMESLIYRTAYALRDRYDFYFIATHVEEILPKFKELGTAIYIGKRWWELARYLRQEQIDLVQYGNIRYYADAALAAGVPIVVERTDGIRSGVALRTKVGVDAVIASTQGTIPHIQKLIASDRIHLIYNGIDMEQFDDVSPDRLGFAESDILIGRASRFSAGKNIGLLIDAVRQLHPDYPQVRLILVGGNSKMPGAQDEESILRKRAESLGDQVIFTGYVENPAAIIKGFDIGTCVSRPGNEGIPNSLIESMAGSSPVVATAVDDIPELVSHGENGLLIADNDLAGLVEALKTLINDPDLRRKFGEAGRSRVEADFNLNAQSQAYGNLYAQLLEKRPSQGEIVLRRIRFSLRLFMTINSEKFIPASVRQLMRRVEGKLRLMLNGDDSR